jgi:hypothetical protein
VGTTPRGSYWLDRVNESSAGHDGEVDHLRECIRRDRRLGFPEWTALTAEQSHPRAKWATLWQRPKAQRRVESMREQKDAENRESRFVSLARPSEGIGD